ncbi:MAG: MoaD/ThiS family protein [Deltaproteobacteria bacterium]|nr:MoaD/ThiS family protein [Deltaproteobacteria bacterium]
MCITVKLHATLKKHLPAQATGDAVVIEVAEGATVADVIRQLGIPPRHAGMTVSGDELLDPAAVLKDGQEINLFPPLAGGSR